MTLLRRLLAALRRPAASRPAASPRREPRPRPEPLESRIAPATLVSSHVVTYLDAVSHLVTIKSSLPIFTSAAVADDILTFDTGKVADHSNSVAETLQKINLLAAANGAPGESISVTDGGHHTANVGSIDSGHHLGTVVVDGDLGQITAGETIGIGSPSSTGLKSLSVYSLGVAAHEILATDSLANVSTINGALGSLSVATDISGAAVKVIGNSFSVASNGNIGSIHVGGSLIGGIDANSGSINVAGKIGSVSILGSITGGDGNTSGVISSTGALGTMVVHGSVVGGNGDESGGVSASGISAITVDGALKGHTFGNYAGTATTPPTALNSGQIVTTSGNMGSVTLGDLIGQGGTGSGSVISKGSISNLTIHKTGTGANATAGSVVGGAGTGSGQISAGSLGHVSIAGALTGGPVSNAGQIATSGSILSVTVGGGVAGGAGTGSGSIITGSGTSFFANLGSLHVTGDLAGGNGDHSGEIEVGGTIGSAAISGSLVSGQGVDAGSIFSQDTLSHLSLATVDGGQISVGNNLGSLTISGGSGTVDSGLVQVAGDAGSITIKGDVVGSSAALPGEILIGGALKTLKVSGKLEGSGVDDTGSIFAALDGTSSLGSATITGGIFGGGGIASGQLFSGGSMGHVSTGAITGNGGSGSGSIVTGGAMGTVVITGNVTGGAGPNSGQISSGSSLGSLSLHGALQSGGAIVSHTLNTPDAETPGKIGTLTISGGVAGGQIDADGDISHLSITGDVTGASQILGDHIGVLSISGALRGGSIHAANDIASLTLGSVAGSSGSPVIISAVGQASPGKSGDFAFGKISVSGDLSYANILAGYDPSGSPVNGNASIGTVTVKGNWTGGNLVAGVKIGNDGVFGTKDDALISPNTAIIPKIAGVVIKGHIEGTSTHYGFVAEQIEAFSVAGKALKLTKTANVPDIYDPTATDTTPISPDAPTDNNTAVREVTT